MPSDPDDFLLRALRARRTGDTGEEVPPELAEEFALLDRIGAAATDDEPVEPVEPPPDLWARIEAATSEDVQTVEASTGRLASPDVAAPAAISLDDRRAARRSARRRLPAWLAVVAVVLVLLVVVAALLQRDGDDSEVVASVELEQLVETGTARADLVRETDDRFRLDLEVDGVEPGDGFLELWLLGPGEEADELRLISLGVINESGSYPLPTGIDLSAFPIVDISVEPFDGDPSHSGNSLLRGEFEA
jgi:anti-sigma-K factor RskA